MLEYARHRRSVERFMTLQAMWKVGVILALSIVLTGCVLSIDPVVSESNATFDQRLLGNWEEVSGSDRALVSRADGNTYSIEWRGDGNVARLMARLGRLGGRPILDVWPAPREADVKAPYADLLVAGHLILSLDIGGGEIPAATPQPPSPPFAPNRGGAAPSPPPFHL